MTDLAAPISPPAAQAAPPPAQKSLLRRMAHRARQSLIGLLAFIGLVTVVKPFLFDLTPMVSGSMSPTLEGDRYSGDWIIGEKLTYKFREPRRGEVVEFHDEDGLNVMKRVMAFAGETIALEKNRVKVNGQFIDPPPGAAHVKYYGFGNLFKPYTVVRGYYVLGDDSIDSQDSRFEGPVKEDQIRGRAMLIVWPLNRIGWVR